MASPPPETDSDREAWLGLFAVAVEGAGSQAALADLLREDRTLVNKILKGTRTLFWTVLLKACRRAARAALARKDPAAVSEMVAGAALVLFDVRGTWTPEDSGPDGGSERDLTEDSAEMHRLQTDAAEAVIKGDSTALRLVEQRAPQTVARFFGACRQEIGRRQERLEARDGQQRLAFGGRR